MSGNRFGWRAELRSGNDILDIQHKALLTKIQHLLEDRHLYNERELGEGIAYLTDYVFEHFTLEESVMLKTTYPGFEEHRDEHSYFVKYIFNLKRQVVLTPEIINDFEVKLNEWFVEHILRTDVKMSDYLRQYCNDTLF